MFFSDWSPPGQLHERHLPANTDEGAPHDRQTHWKSETRSLLRVSNAIPCRALHLLHGGGESGSRAPHRCTFTNRSCTSRPLRQAEQVFEAGTPSRGPTTIPHLGFWHQNAKGNIAASAPRGSSNMKRSIARSSSRKIGRCSSDHARTWSSTARRISRAFRSVLATPRMDSTRAIVPIFSKSNVFPGR